MVTRAEEIVRESWIRWAQSLFQETRTLYEKYYDYYVGDHPLTFATDKWLEIFGETFEEFSDNWCEVVVDATAERLEVVGWDSEDDKDAAKKAEELWDQNVLGIDEDILYTQTLVKGDGFLLVWPEEDSEADVDIAYGDAIDVQVAYDPANYKKIIRAAKQWQDEKGQVHLRIYQRDFIYSFYIPTSEADQLAFMVQMVDDWGDMLVTMPEGWELEQEPIRNEWGIVPVFHFKNKPGDSTYGISELKQVIPVQNSVNKLLMDLMVGSEFGSFRQKAIFGAAEPEGGWKAGADRVWASSDSETRAYEFDQIDLEPAVRAIEMAVGHIAKMSRTPMHYLRPSGDMPSGEALKSAESGLVKKVKRRQKMWGLGPWSQAMGFALRVDGTEPKSPVFPVWAPAETRHELELAQTQQLKAVLGVPIQQLWLEMGYSKEQIEEWLKTNQAIETRLLSAVVAQSGQVPPGMSMDPKLAEQLLTMLGGGVSLDSPQVAALLGKGVTAGTTSGESTVRPQPNTSPPASATRRSRGFRN